MERILFEQLLNVLPDAVLVFDASGRLIFSNLKADTWLPQIRKTIPVSSPSTLSDPTVSCSPTPAFLYFYDLFSSELLQRYFTRTVQTGRGVTLHEQRLLVRPHPVFSSQERGVISVQIDLEPLDTSSFGLSTHSTAAGYSAGVLMVLKDRSEMDKLETKLQDSETLANLGVLASGLAHEIGNPLGAIRGAAQLLQQDSAVLSQNRDLLTLILRETGRIQRLVKDLLALARPGTLHLRALNVHQVLDELIFLQQKSAAQRSIEWVRRYDPSLPLIEADEDRLKQVFLNLFLNAQQAIEAAKKSASRIEIGTRLVHDYQLKTKLGATHFIEISISDNGCGMDQDFLENLFVPFHTSKKTGTGLGLALSKRLVEAHGGFIEVESKKNHGSTFRVFLKSQKFYSVEEMGEQSSDTHPQN